jgi:hypothetical protein
MTARGRDAGAEGLVRQGYFAIGTMTVRGRGLSLTTGQSLAAAVADALAWQLAGRSARIGHVTIRLPASTLDAGGGIARAAFAEAVAGARREPHA